MTRHVLVAVAWPYANGQSHIGHFAGAYLPADIFARYHRVAGNKVLMVSGSDAHGTPITVKAEQEGVEPADIVNRYHPIFLEQWERYGISFDLFTTTMTDNHREVVWDMFRTLRDNGYIDTKVTQQFFDPKAERFLPDRYVEGTCPNCGYDGARGDQCDNCGKTLDPIDLIDPHSKLTGAVPEMRDTEHFFILLPRLQDQVLAWLETVQDWRAHVINWAKGFLKDGLIDRAITRDLTWGVPLPHEADTLGESKRIYVWFEAVIGYLSASKEWAKSSGDPDAWKAWWEDPSAETHYFIGKDNIPFHSVFWPAYLIGYGGLNLPTNVPANQYVTFKGEKASKSRGIGTPLLDYLNDYQADAVRYAVGTVLPETNDNDFSEDDMVRRINDELVAAWGNLVNRVFAMTHKNFDGVVQEPELADGDRSLLDDVDGLLAEAGELLEKVELRAALRKAMGIAQAANVYLNATEPWRTAKDDPVRTGTSLWVATQAIAAGSIGLAPWLPFSTGPLRVALSLEPDVVGAGWARPEVPVGATLGELAPLFAKIDVAVA